MDHGLVDAETLFIDSTPVKANANKKKSIKKLVRAHARTYQEQLDQEIEKERLKNGKKVITSQEES